jgi:hypothetical protein
MITAAAAEAEAEAKALEKAVFIMLGRRSMADGLICNPHPMSDAELFQMLKESVALFDKGRTNGDGGKAGMILWIRTLSILALSQFDEIRDLTLLRPGQCLLGALDDLDEGNVHPALRSAVLPHAHRAPRDVRVLKSVMLVAADEVYETARRNDDAFTRKQADKKVLELFGAAARRLSVNLTAQKLESWRREARASQNSPTVAAISSELIRAQLKAQLSCLAQRGMSTEDRLHLLVHLVNLETSTRCGK